MRQKKCLQEKARQIRVGTSCEEQLPLLGTVVLRPVHLKRLSQARQALGSSDTSGKYMTCDMCSVLLEASSLIRGAELMPIANMAAHSMPT